LFYIVLGVEGEVRGSAVRPALNIRRRLLALGTRRRVALLLIEQERERVKHQRATPAAHTALRRPEHDSGDAKNRLTLRTLREQVSDAPRSGTPTSREWRTRAYQTMRCKPVSRKRPAIRGFQRGPSHPRRAPGLLG